MWFDDLGDLVRVVAVGASSYVALVIVLRTSGKRTLAKLNAFDLVVTVAFGSVLATSLLSPSTSWTEALAAFVVLAAAQYVVAALSVRSRRLGRAVRARPTALVVRGRLDRDALTRERVTLADVRAAVRRSGGDRVEDVAAVVLETDGSLSVVPTAGEDASALADVAGWQTDRHPGPSSTGGAR